MTQIYDADFSNIKQGIIDFFESDDTFNSYNFEGSATNNIINIFSLIEQNATFYLNSTANEFFVSSATQTKNIYKNARKLNYFPTRKSAGYIEVEFASVSDLTIPIFSEFTMGDLNLVLFENVVLDVSNSRTATVRLYEGDLLRETAITNTTELFSITLETNYPDIDNDYVYVFVDPLVSGTYPETTTPWVNADNEIVDTGSNSYLVNFTNTDYTVQFDTGRVFNVPNLTDQVRVLYLNTTGDIANGTGGTVTTDISGLTVDSGSNVIVNGTTNETDAEIKNRASRYHSSQRRGVTENDWNSIIKKYSKYNILKDALMWGGEKENVSVLLGDNIVETPDTYQNVGKVIVTSINSDYDFLNTTEESDLTDFLEKYKIAGLELRFLQPNVIKIDPSISIKVDASLSFSQTTFETAVNNYLNDLEFFDSNFYKSKLTQFINEQSAIQYSDVSFTTSVRVNNESYKVIRLGSAITPNSINETIDGLVFDDNGAGTMRYDGSNVGTINYTTGFITLTSAISALDEYEFSFTYDSDLVVSALRESILQFDDISVINL